MIVKKKKTRRRGRNVGVEESESIEREKPSAQGATRHAFHNSSFFSKTLGSRALSFENDAMMRVHLSATLLFVALAIGE